MNVDQYFRDRADLIARVLLDAPESRPFTPDWRFYGAGLGCIGASTMLVLWTAFRLVDPGYFARTSVFMMLVLGAGVLLLVAPLLADLLLARTTLRSRDAVKGTTLSRLLEIDGALARTLAGANS